MDVFKNIIKSEDGSILGMVLIFFLVLTIIGTAFLSMASQEGKLSIRSVQRTQALTSAESGINIGLWRLNHGPDSQGTFSTGSMSVTYDSVARILTSTGTSVSVSKTVSVELWQDHPFNHVVAYKTQLDTSNYTLNNLKGHGIRPFDPLPEVDFAYYDSIANYHHVGDTSFSAPIDTGIHYIDGNVTMKNGSSLIGTLFVTGGIKFTGTVSIQAQQMPDSSLYYPAVVVGDTAETDILGTPLLIIKGAVFSTGYVNFKGDTLTGPIVANKVVLKSGVVITDYGSEKYYNYPPGFLGPDIYDWEKFIKKGSWASSN
ncbi:MAG: pilus assembly PilX N-terminal domain-containing protein [Candidatus Marinimicrobia bacterium]|nr:pilus assembly PilX N-terminal domain-containing protein [Candidatus Neomarinimicrobiota bacterium]